MSRFDSESLNAPHTQRHLDEIPQSAPTAEKMAEAALARAGLVKRLRSLTRFPAMGGCHMVDDETIDEAADRIEFLEASEHGLWGRLETSRQDEAKLKARIDQLERELSSYRLATKHANDHADAAIEDLAAEKALADQADAIILKIINGPQVECIPDNDIQADIAAYRKARGL